ncbi:hypothetical protein BZJ17_07000 [Salinivibrio sp. IB574]|uniref:bifunctional diguanylate cyclase/phosphodiesterase n=1 Tax=Salinivibrio sp. IB574 TaxID=1909444 RepID=UPI000988F6F4|nr:EAL domain-containing protein [Salinivibrio sp. IB574]OOF22273.1 hypothetical protein BZJ17_07000 [Salinivibrio sp. IB574]
MTLHQRVVLFVVAAALLTALATAAVAFQLGITQLKNEQQQQVSLLSAAMAEALPPIIEQSDNERLNQLVAHFMAAPQVKSVSVMPMLSGQRQLWQADARAIATPSWFVHLSGIESASKTVSVSNGWTQLARVTVEVSPLPAVEALWNRMSQLVTLLAAMCAVIPFAASFMFRRVTTPLAELDTRLNALGRGDYQPAKSRTRVKDLQALLQAFNLAGQQVARVHKSQQEELSRLRDKLMIDPVSRLPNRGYFQHQLQSFIKDDVNCTLLLIETEWLSRLRARYGYQYRDQCWRLLGEALSHGELAERHKLVARLSHNEVAILLTSVDEGDIRPYLQRLLRVVNQELENISLPANQGFHIGVAKTQDDDAASLLAKADNALQQAKRRSEVYHWPSHANADSRTREQWRNILLDALNKNPLTLYAQPVRHRDNQTNWHQEVYAHLWVDEAWLSAGQLLNRIEMYALGEEFDRHVLTRADQYIKAHPDSDKLAINLTVESVRSTAFHDWLANYLLKTYLSDKLAFEVAEEAVQVDIAACQTLFKMIREHGFDVGIDHFGRDMDNVNYIHDIEPDYVKLDIGFGQPSSDVDDVFIRMLINIAAAQEIRVIATGIEQSDQHQYFHQLGCHGYQGYILPPVQLDNLSQSASLPS